MLHLFYALRPEGLVAEYNAPNAYRGLSQFVAALPDGRDTYMAAVRAASRELYDAALKSSGKRWFLDKTPRYYLIISELIETFPEATFLFLVRNPLDVFSSILESLAGGEWTKLARIDLFHDLISAPKAILEARSALGGRQVLVRYEELAERPDRPLEVICRTLGVKFDPKMLRYATVDVPKRFMGDWTGVHRHQAPMSDYIAVWRRRLDTRWKKELALAYLRHLGPDTVEGLGYEYSALEKGLLARGSISGSGSHRWHLISTPPAERSWRDALQLATARSLHERGWLRTILRAFYIGLVGRVPSPSPTGRGGR